MGIVGWLSPAWVGDAGAMLTAKPQLNLKNAKCYFKEHLAVGDYYSEGKEVGGQWVGVGAEKLGLKGVVREEDFLKLCDGVIRRWVCRHILRFAR